MSNEELKAAALAATPGPWKRTVTRFNGITNSTHSMASFSSEGVLANANEKRDAIFIAAANPATVLALLAELESSQLALKNVTELWNEQRQRIAELVEREKRVVALANGNDELWEAMAHRLKTLEDKLATPVRLPTEHELHQVACSECAGNCLELVESTVRAAGFTVSEE